MSSKTFYCLLGWLTKPNFPKGRDRQREHLNANHFMSSWHTLCKGWGVYSTTRRRRMSTLKNFLSGLDLAPARTHCGLTLFALIASECIPKQYLTLEEALSTKCARVTEVSVSGSVPELRFENLGDKPVLLLDGEELVGARQNRVLNTSVLVGACQTVTIPVSCVERGRWAYVSSEFHCSERKLFASARASKMEQVSQSLRSDGGRRADQARVWAELAQAAAHFDVRSETGAMRDVYDQQTVKLESYEAAFQAMRGEVGAVFALGDRIVGLDVFDTDDTFRLLLRKLVSAYAFDALRQSAASGTPPSKTDVLSFLERVWSATATSYEAVGEGKELRLCAPGLAGAAIVHSDRPVHVAAFAVAY